MATTGVSLAPGELFGGYRILDVIGIGGMAIVYLAEQRSRGREVALKVLSPALTRHQPFRERLRRDGETVAALDHPNIIAIYDSGEIEGRLFLAMQLVHGMTLAGRMRLEGLTAEQTLRLLSPIADALDAAHAAGLVHRAVKPQHILISANGRPYLADLGIAKGLATGGLTARFVGSYNYAAPEQILGWPITPATDVYGLAAVLYECFTGDVPFPRLTDAEVLHAHVYEPPPTIDQHQLGAEEFDELTARALAKEPEERYGSAGELMRAAAAVVQVLPAARLLVSPPFVRTLARANRHAHATGDARGAARRIDGGQGAMAALGRRRGAKRWLQRLLLAPAGAGVLVVIVVGTTGLGGRGGSAGRELYTAQAPPFTIVYASPWRSARNPVTGSFALVAAPVRDRSRPGAGAGTGTRTGSEVTRLAAGDATLAAGELSASASTPGDPPPALLRRYGRPSVSADARIAEHEGREYAWSSPSRRIVAYVLPMARGDGAIICGAPASAIRALASCRTLVARAHVSATAILAPGGGGSSGQTSGHGGDAVGRKSSR